MTIVPFRSARPLDVAVIGSGVSGLAAAWLLSKAHRVTLYEKEDRPGGHANTVEAAPGVAVDTGFIVYNAANYPNLVALFDHLGVATRPTDMSFAASLGDGRIEYAGGPSPAGLFAQKSNLLRPRFWRMLADIVRFYRNAPALLSRPEGESLTLGAFLDEGGYSDAFIEDHLLPMAAAIWSSPAAAMRDHPAAAFVRFCDNHGLLKLTGRPVWRTVEGGSRAYVERLTAALGDGLLLNQAAAAVRRDGGRAQVRDRGGDVRSFDHVVLACHADQALALLEDADEMERDLLGAFAYERNLAVLHDDPALMPRRRAVWSSWNYLSRADGQGGASVCVTYWMNRLQSFLPPDRDLFVTLNPNRPPPPSRVLRSFLYDHPVFDLAALKAQKSLWRLQGRRNAWFCGAYFGAGFHEDGLQAGLAAAEALGGVRRPWRVEGESSRIHLAPGIASASEAA